MLEQINIENIGIIEKSSIDFTSGLNVITGETGAGKSMILASLGLLLGQKADSSLVMHGAKEAVVEGILQGQNLDSNTTLRGAGIDIDNDDAIIALRKVSSQGRSRAFLGSRSVQIGVLSEFTNEFVTIHGQADQLKLRTSSQQRKALDEYCGETLVTLLGELKETWEERKALQKKLHEIIENQRERAQRAALLRGGIAKIEEISPMPNEDEELAEKSLLAINANDIKQYINATIVSLDGDEEGGAGALQLLWQGNSSLEKAAQLTSNLQEVQPRFASLQIELQQIVSDLNAALNEIDLDPEEIEKVEQRRAQLNDLKKSYGQTLGEVLAWKDDASRQLLEIDSDDYNREKYQRRIEELSVKLQKLSTKVSAERKLGAQELSERVTAEIRGLLMGAASFEVGIQEAEEINSYGKDIITFTLKSHAQAEKLNISQGASGGELSRLMLALELIRAEKHPDHAQHTLIFDEIDAGVGGKSANEIAKRLKRLSANMQVIVITHLAQVAAYADNQLVVVKQEHPAPAGESGKIVRSIVRPVLGEDRISELARMLSGTEDSANARSHARELLEATQ